MAGRGRRSGESGSSDRLGSDRADEVSVEVGRAMDLDLFSQEGIKGEMHKATGEEAPFEIGSLETPISHGLSEGYSIQDIAHFYITTRMAKEDKADWAEKSKDDTWLDANIDRIETAFEECVARVIVVVLEVESDVRPDTS